MALRKIIEAELEVSGVYSKGPDTTEVQVALKGADQVYNMTFDVPCPAEAPRLGDRVKVRVVPYRAPRKSAGASE